MPRTTLRSCSCGVLALIVVLAGCQDPGPAPMAPESTEAEPPSPPQGGQTSPPTREAFPLLILDQIEQGTPVVVLAAVPPGLQATVLTLDGGEVLSEAAPDGESALRFPAWAEGEIVPRAVVRIAPAEGPWPEGWEPADRGFLFGADFLLDEQQGDVPPDDGDNLVQRGIHSETSQFKLEIDQSRPACRVAGSSGAVEVRSQVRVSSDSWHRAECEREGETVILRVSEWQGDAFVEIDVTEGSGVTGVLSWPGSTPISVGGKMTPHGEVMQSATDQFNGAIARPFLSVAAPSGQR